MNFPNATIMMMIFLAGVAMAAPMTAPTISFSAGFTDDAVLQRSAVSGVSADQYQSACLQSDALLQGKH